jgi:hypothetical protein
MTTESRKDKPDSEPQISQEITENTDASASENPSFETPGDIAASDAAVPATPGVTGHEPSLADELASMRSLDSSQAGDFEDADPVASSSVVDEGIETAEIASPHLPPAESTPPEFSSAEPSTSSAPERPYFGPARRLSDLPHHITAALDDESAATLKAVMENPDQFDPGILDHTSIRGEYMALSRAEPGRADYEVPWFHGPLPPLRLEMILVKYDGLIERAIELAARRIDKDTDSKIDGKIRDALYTIRSEMRLLWR